MAEEGEEGNQCCCKCCLFTLSLILTLGVGLGVFFAVFYLWGEQLDRIAAERNNQTFANYSSLKGPPTEILRPELDPKDVEKLKQGRGLWAHNQNFHEQLVGRINEERLKGPFWEAVYNKYAVHLPQGVSSEKAFGNTAKISDEEKYQTETILYDEKVFKHSKRHRRDLRKLEIEIPSKFDAGDKWSKCPSIQRVPNQGGCGSSWAVAAASVIQDRICIKSVEKGNSDVVSQPQISAQDIISCCSYCGHGCYGANTFTEIGPFIMWREEGVVTGGYFASNEGCLPYATPSDCGTPCAPTHFNKNATQMCSRQCIEQYRKSYEQDKYYGSKAYWLSASGAVRKAFLDHDNSSKDLFDLTTEERAELLKKELMTYGPVMACFDLLEDFQHYHRGIYHHVAGKALYTHCARIVGWGEEDQIKFWVLVNSWGRNWGEYGKFRLHQNMTPVTLLAGLPKHHRI